MPHTTDPTPDTTSSEYDATYADRILVHDMLRGLPAVKAKTTTYLTKWAQEPQEVYDQRLADACFTPLFKDILFGLTSKPFTREVTIKEGATDRIEALTENIDGEGNNLSVFSRHVFEAGIRDGLCAVMVDYPRNTEARTRRDEQELGLRPYWVKVEAANLLALYTEMKGGVEVITHARIRETTLQRSGWGEVLVTRVRVLEPGMWQLWESTTGHDTKENATWQMVDEGTTSLPYVPLVVFYAGEREGPQLCRPPFVDLARMQLELFRQENNLKVVETRTAFPIYTANGMAPPTDGNTLSVGPAAILFATAEGSSWDVLEPAGTSLTHLKDRIEGTMTEMRRLGMQPLMPGSGTISATASSIEAAKAHSAVQMMALGLKDTLENALAITAEWIGERAEAEVFVHTDFDVGFMSDQSLQALLALYENGTISRDALLMEMKRRNVLMADYDIDVDADQIAEEKEAAMSGLPDLIPITSDDEPDDQSDADEQPSRPASDPQSANLVDLITALRRRGMAA